ncbi:acetate kinase, partial [human gut metagenome]
SSSPAAIGEHDEIARRKGLPPHGLAGHPHRYRKNEHPVGDVCDITAWGAKVRTLVIATDEELMIARDTKEVLEK